VTNESYLVVSYFAVLVLVTAIANACFLVLRRSFEQLTQLLPKAQFARLLRVCFPVGIVLPALAGMLSVSFVSCTRGSYQEIVADRAYLILKNQEQARTSLHYLLIALGFWTLIVIAVLALSRRRHRDGPE